MSSNIQFMHDVKKMKRCALIHTRGCYYTIERLIDPLKSELFIVVTMEVY